MPPASDVRWSLVSEAFDAVVELAPAERAAALDRLCAGADDPAALRAEVEALLDADAEAATVPTDGHLSDVAALLTEEARPGERVGPWRVVREIGRGGMGRVDLVERADGAYAQRAALKRLSLVAPGRVRRFLRERQILATLDHPGIARLLDGGVAEDGAPYLVMEYVEGEPITRYAARQRLGLRERLALFVQVCDAVAYAHRHLVVHRDLKPSNVLVGERRARTGEADLPTGAAQATLLDFGVARLLDAADDDPLTAEAPGAPLTPGYAAPEQVEGGAVTTATDVWALGVLLYELLAGRRPFAGATREAWSRSVLRADATAPSQAATGRGGADPARLGAAADGLGAADLRRLRGDLDAICLTALRREPAERYGSAHDLAADLRRYLAGEPVEARRPSAWYRARRFVGRHRTATAAAALVALAVVGGGAATAWQARAARASAAESAATAEFLADLFQGADPTAAGDSLLALDLLDRGARRLGAELAGQPGTRAALTLAVGDAYLGLGRADSAEALARRALALRRPRGAAPDRAGAVRARVLLGRALYRSDPAAGDDALARATADARALGDDAVLLDALEARGLLGAGDALPPADAVAVLDEAAALCRRIEGEASPRLGRLLSTLAVRVASVGQHGRMEPLLREALAVQPPHTDPFGRSTTLLDLAQTLLFSGRSGEARPLAVEAHGLRRDLFGADDGRTARALAVLADLDARADAGREALAEANAREAARVARATGDRATEVQALLALGTALGVLGRTAEAAEVAAARLEVVREAYGEDSPRFAGATQNLAFTLSEAGRHGAAAEAWDRTVARMEASHGPDAASTVSALSDAGHWAAVAGRPGRAENLLAEAAARADALPARSRTRALALLRLGRLRLDRGRPEAALAPLRAAVAAREALGRPGHVFRADAASDGARAAALLGEALLATGRPAEAAPLLAEAAPALAAALGPDHADARRARSALGASR